MDRQRLIAEAEQLRDEGRDRAALHREFQIKATQLALLQAILRSPNRTATLDDATPDLEEAFEDGGRWRGSIPRGLNGLIESAGVVLSSRPSRHRGFLTRWRGLDDGALTAKCRELEGWIGANFRDLGLQPADLTDVDSENQPTPPLPGASERSV
jgi:hypothetical protein